MSKDLRREARIRRAASKINLIVRKSRYRHPELKAFMGGYMLVDAADNAAVLGAQPNAYSANLDEIEDYVRSAT